MNPQDFNLKYPAYSVNELLELLPLGRTSLYYAVKEGRLKAHKLGKKTLFLAPDIVVFLESLQSSNQPPKVS
jgi:excisionase family DNA binding protein